MDMMFPDLFPQAPPSPLKVMIKDPIQSRRGTLLLRRVLWAAMVHTPPNSLPRILEILAIRVPDASQSTLLSKRSPLMTPANHDLVVIAGQQDLRVAGDIAIEFTTDAAKARQIYCNHLIISHFR